MKRYNIIDSVFCVFVCIALCFSTLFTTIVRAQDNSDPDAITDFPVGAENDSEEISGNNTISDMAEGINDDTENTVNVSDDSADTPSDDHDAEGFISDGSSIADVNEYSVTDSVENPSSENTDKQDEDQGDNANISDVSEPADDNDKSDTLDSEVIDNPAETDGNGSAVTTEEKTETEEDIPAEINESTDQLTEEKTNSFDNRNEDNDDYSELEIVTDELISEEDESDDQNSILSDGGTPGGLSNWYLERIDGNGYITSEDFKDKIRILIFFKGAMRNGQSVCVNSSAVVEEMTASRWARSNKYKLIFVEANGSPDEEISQFVSKYAKSGSNAVFAKNGSDIMSEYINALDIDTFIMFPVVVVLDDDHVVGFTMGYQDDRSMLDLMRDLMPVSVPNTDISLPQTAIPIKLGEWAILHFISTDDGGNESVSWTSSNPGVATVSDGVVSAAGKGSATIEATSSSGKKRKWKIRVIGSDYVYAESLDLKNYSYSDGQFYVLPYGAPEHYQVQFSISPSNASDKKAEWYSENESIVKVDEKGTLFDVKPGKTTVWAFPHGFSDFDKELQFLDVRVYGVDFGVKSVTVKEGKYYTFKNMASYPANPCEERKWLSSNEKIATVDSYGKIHGVRAGTCTITARTYFSNYYMDNTITVTVKGEPVKSVKMNKTALTVNVGNSAALKATISPSNAANKKVTWKSSNTKVATVDARGNVIGRSKGTATITVTTADGKKKATCKITVKDPAACTLNGFCRYNGKDYWYENGIRQAVPGDPKNLIDEKYHVERGREIYDPKTNAWYWLDAVYGGAKAVGKEVWMPYIYQDEAKWTYTDKVKLANESDPGMADCVLRAMQNKDGKWVRYDQNGKMMKGWVTITGDLATLYPGQNGNTYYYDTRTGLMAKGWVNLGGRWRHFDEVSGVLLN